MKSWWLQRLPILNTCVDYLKQYQVPKNLNLWYCFGILAIVIFLGQWISGLWLTMFYTPSVDGAFDSIEYIMRDVSFGWLFRYIHTTGASAFFIILYLHFFRGLLYGSYQKPRELVWIFGVILLLLTMMEAFFGQILPWSQISYWGAQVITSLFSVLPGGESCVTWLRGDYAVGDATLHRFFALHVIAMPLVIMILILLHVIALHQVGANNPDGIDITKSSNVGLADMDYFYPKYWYRDILAILIFGLIFFSIVFFTPDLGGLFLEKANFSPANPNQTIDSIAPMWYMLPFYNLLRAFPSKTGGVIAMFSAVLILFFLPWLDKSAVRSMRYKGIVSKMMLTMFVLNFIFLGYIGTLEITPILQKISQISAVLYFAYFIFMPCYTRCERYKSLPVRITI